MPYISCYPPAFNSEYVKATTDNTPYEVPEFLVDPDKSLIGGPSGNCWITRSGIISNQRFHIDLGYPQVIKRIYYENYHINGTTTDLGVKNFTFWGSNSSTDFNDLIYANDGTWQQLITNISQFERHISSNVSDPRYVIVTNTTPYRYYAFKFVDNFIAAFQLGFRRIELQRERSTNKFPLPGGIR